MKTIADLQDDIYHYRLCKALGASRIDDLKDEINTTLLNLQKLYQSKNRQELLNRVNSLFFRIQFFGLNERINIMYVVWAVFHWYYPYHAQKVYLKVLDKTTCWTQECGQATKFSDFDHANNAHKAMIDLLLTSKGNLSSCFDVVLGTGKV